jgi:hypothetical protein
MFIIRFQDSWEKGEGPDAHRQDTWAGFKISPLVYENSCLTSILKKTKLRDNINSSLHMCMKRVE